MSNELDDPARLAALERSGLMRKEAGARFTHVCYTVTQLLNSDVSMLSVITSDRQRFVAEWPRTPLQPELDLSQSGCKEVVLTNRLVAITDTRLHPVLCRMSWSAIWQGYASAPVVLDGQPIGALCALTVGRRQWSAHDEHALSGLADLVSASLQSELKETP